MLDDSSHRGERSLEVMCHPAFIDNTIRQSAYCLPRLTELDVLTSASLKYAIAERGYRLGSYLDVCGGKVTPVGVTLSIFTPEFCQS